MQKLIGILVFLAVSVQADTFGDWEYEINNGEVTITGYTGTSLTAVFPSVISNLPVTAIGSPLNYGGPNSAADWPVCGENLTTTSIVVPDSVTSIGRVAFQNFQTLTNATLPQKFLSAASYIGLRSQVGTDYMISALANNDAFVTAVANKILAASNNYGLATQSGVSNTITATTSNLVTQSEILTLATKTELTNALAQSRTDGINSVISNPNLWTLYTTNQIHAMAIGDLVLTSTNNGQFVLNYDIEQSEDLVNWTPYQGFALPLTNLPTNKAFVRIKAKQ